MNKCAPICRTRRDCKDKGVASIYVHSNGKINLHIYIEGEREGEPKEYLDQLT